MRMIENIDCYPVIKDNPPPPPHCQTVCAHIHFQSFFKINLHNHDIHTQYFCLLILYIIQVD